MAHIRPVSTQIPNDPKNCTSQWRRELFPMSDDDSDELGHIGPLSDSTPPDSPSLSSYNNKTEDTLTQQNLTNFIKSTISDYIILENICDNDNRDLTKSMETTEDKTPLSNRHSCEINDYSMPPLYLSPMQLTLHSDIISSPKNCEENTTTLSKSPTLKTPQSTTIINVDVPKLIRKSPLANCCINVEPGKRKMPFFESPSANKHPKLDQGSRVRTALFPKSEIVVPTTSFYAKSNTSYLSHTFKNVSIKTSNTNYKSSSLYLCSRKGRRFGQINAGVQHKIRKPKQKKITNTRFLKDALNIIDNSPLNDYLNNLKNMFPKENISKQHVNNAFNETSISMSVPQQNLETQINNEDDLAEVLDLEITQKRKRELSPSPDPNKKFFKFKRSSATVTVDKHLKLEINDGKFSILGNKKLNKKRKAVSQLKLNLDATDLIVPETETLISPEKIDDILFSLDNDNDKENDTNSVQVMNMYNEIPECPEQHVLKAHNSVAMSENAIHLHTEKQQCRSNNSSLNCSVVPKQQNEQSILLSPTSQMCSMASGLALNSPRKAKQNSTNSLTSTNNIESINEICFTSEIEQGKLFPIFYGANKVSPKKVKTSKAIPTSKKLKPLPKSQMLLDAGQKKFGATQCSECKFVYHMGDPNDELIHLNYHNAGNIFRFTGWKDEHVVAQFSNARIIRVLPSDPNSWLRKVKDLLEVVNRDLGYYEMEANLDHSQVFLYIKHKTIAGCLVAESKSTAYRMLSDNVGIDLCSEKSYPVKCGISRIWVSQSSRKEGIATSLMNFLRSNFVYGGILNKDDIAFSSPTEAGKAFAIKYFNTPNFLIYA